jgi:hypothetical protein
VLGSNDRGGGYDFLVLTGEKDPRFVSKYADDLEFVFFLVPRNAVDVIKSKGRTHGSMIRINMPSAASFLQFTKRAAP